MSETGDATPDQDEKLAPGASNSHDAVEAHIEAA